MKFNIENVPILGKIVKKGKLEAQALKLKKDFLNTFTINQLKEIIKKKGLSTKKLEVTSITLEEPNPERELNFNELVGAIAWQITGKSLVIYAEQHKIECMNFKLAYKNIITAIEAMK